MKSFVVIIARESVRTQICSEFEGLSDSFEIIAEADELEAGRRMILRNRPDLVILDLETPGGDPFLLFEGNAHRKYETIVVSDNDQNTLRALRLRAMDYFIVPLQKGELHSSLASFLRDRSIMTISSTVKAYFRSLNDCQLVKIAAPTPMGFRFITLKDVIRFQKAGRRTMVKMKSGRVVMISRSVRKLKKMMAEGHFYRVNEMELVNLYEVVEYRKGRKPWVQMSDGFRIPLPLKRVDTFLEAMAPIELGRGK